MLQLIEALQRELDPEEWNKARLRPPASAEARARLAAEVEVVPAALEALYRWHDGSPEEYTDLYGIDAIGTGRLLSIEEALSFRERTRGIRKDFSPTHLPYVAVNGGADLHVVETARGPVFGWRGLWDHEISDPIELEEPLALAIRLGLEMSLPTEQSGYGSKT